MAGSGAIKSAISPVAKNLATGPTQDVGGKIADKTIGAVTPQMGTQGTKLNNLQVSNAGPKAAMTAGDMAPRQSLAEKRGVNLTPLSTASSSPTVAGQQPSHLSTGQSSQEVPRNPFGQASPQSKGAAADYFAGHPLANQMPMSPHGDQGVRNPNGHSALHPANLLNMGSQTGLAGLQGGINGLFNGTGFTNNAISAGGAALGQQAVNGNITTAGPASSQVSVQQAGNGMEQMMKQMEQTSMMQMQYQNVAALIKMMVEMSKEVAKAITAMGKGVGEVAR